MVNRMENTGIPARRYSVEGGYTVDCDRQLVLGADDEIHLRRKSFRVLEVLIENRDRAISKDELLQLAWDGTAVSDDVLVTSIAEIRRAFGDDPRASKFVKTIHGTGYRWIAAIIEEAPGSIENEAALAPSSRKLFRIIAAAAGFVVLLFAGTLMLRSSHAPVEHISEAAWWRFDETTGDAVLDSSGHRNNGRIASGVKRISGHRGGALLFDGTGDGVAGSTGESIPMGNAPRTITAWVKTDSTNGDFTSLLHYGVNGTQPPAANFSVSLTPDGRIRAGNGFHPGFVTAASRIDDGAWHFIAIVYEGSASSVERIYVDGMEDVNGQLSGSPATVNGGVWSIGRFLGGGTRFRGALDDMRVFDRALTPAEVQALDRCSSGVEDFRGANGYYFMPVMGGNVKIENGEIVNTGLDIGGVQLAQSDGACSAKSLRGASIGQDVYVSADLKIPVGNGGMHGDAGLYFRSRRAHAGDGIIGGTSAGYLVRLNSSGLIAVACLNPGRVVAFTNVTGFSSEMYHHLEVIAVGETLQVRLEGALLEFDQNGRHTTTVSIPSLWSGPPQVGENEGAAGVEFTAEYNRGRVGGQRVRNFIARPAAQ